MTTKLKRITVSLTQEHHDGLHRLALERGTSVSGLLREAASEMLEDEEDIREGLEVLADERGTVGWEEYKKSRGCCAHKST